MNSYIIIFQLVFLAASFKLIDYAYHKKQLGQLDDLPSEISYQELSVLFKKLIYKKLDNYIAIFLYMACYLFIFAAILISKQINSIWMDITCVLFISGRVRSLQELGHYSIHYALCPNNKLGMILANLCYQYPWHMTNAINRRRIHVKEHHRRVNMANDPDLEELKNKKIYTNISEWQFWKGVFYPITPNGIWQRLTELYVTFKTGRFLEKLGRITCTTVLIGFVYMLASWRGVIIFYCIPLLIVYPLFYWIAHLSLHRWYADCPENIDYHQREILLGRPTNFGGIIGAIVKTNIFPYGDSYHLAHSLFPTTRWHFLPKIDAILKKSLAGYCHHESNGLIFKRGAYPSALSELRDRLVVKN